jgi:hypothetical protein
MVTRPALTAQSVAKVESNNNAVINCSEYRPIFFYAFTFCGIEKKQNRISLGFTIICGGREAHIFYLFAITQTGTLSAIKHF